MWQSSGRKWQTLPVMQNMNSVFLFNHLIKKRGYIVRGDFMYSLYEVRLYVRNLKVVEILTFLHLTVYSPLWLTYFFHWWGRWWSTELLLSMLDGLMIDSFTDSICMYKPMSCKCGTLIWSKKGDAVVIDMENKQVCWGSGQLCTSDNGHASYALAWEKLWHVLARLVVSGAVVVIPCHMTVPHNKWH